MRFHKSSTTESLIARGPSTIAMMIASEFWRAREGAEFTEEAIRSLWRARELMGVLEIANLPEKTSQQLLPYYSECKLAVMFNPTKLTTPGIEAFSLRMAEAFDRIAKDLAHA